MAERDSNSVNKRETDKNNKENSVEQNIDYIPKKKLEGLPNSQESKKEIDKAKEEIDNFKKKITGKFKYIEAMGIVPMQAAPKIEEEYEVPEEEAKKKLMHILVVIPEDKYSDLGKMKLEAIELSKKMDQKIWVHILTAVDLWNLGLDSKFDILEAFGMCFPLMDKGILGALRVSTIHKTLVLRKFEKYVTSYVIAGSLVRGTTTETSDVDVFIVIDDTDVKRMSRYELKEKLRSIIYQYIAEASAIAGVKNVLNVQVYLLTDFWESVKDAHPVIFTFIRDGIPLYDRGAFMPWKSLLRQGRIKPSPEAIDMYMSMGDKLEESINRRLLDLVVNDIYWGVLTPSQALLMLYGMAPPTPKDTVKQIREIFVDKEKMLEEKYAKILENIVQTYKDYEHEKVKKMTGKEIDEFLKNTLDYMKRLKELREQIDKKMQEKTMDQVYKDVFGMIGAMLKKDKEEDIIKEFDDRLVKIGRFPHKFLENLKFIAHIKKELEKEEKQSKKKKEKDMPKEKETKDVDKARKLGLEITNALIEYNQRCDFLSMDRSKFVIKAKDKTAEIFFLDTCFVIHEGKVFTLKNGKLCTSDSNIEELRKQLQDKQHKQTRIDYEALQDLKKVFGDFELTY